ncbi:MAG: Crp/Fnr family transcriptional regulator [Cyclobacteriaceae bacterium]
MSVENKDILINLLASLAPLSEEERQLLRNVITRGKYRTKDYILIEGDVCTNIFFITKGIARFGLTDDSGAESTLKFRAENEFITDYGSFLTNKPSERFIEAIEDLECLKLDRVALQTIYENVRYGDRIGRIIAQNLFLEANQRIENMYKLTPEERYLRMVNSNGKLLNRIPQSYIASHIGVLPQSLSRIKRRFMTQ